jgi:5'-phosphate synthase pdxT subunit
LALQGDVREHVAALRDVGVKSRLVQNPSDLDGLAGCVLPGGESTTLSMLLTSTGLWGPLADMISGGLPVFGTCAGLVLLANQVLDGRADQRSFGALDVAVRRNGFGRQLASFEVTLEIDDRLSTGQKGTSGGSDRLPAVFIRAPMVVRAGLAVEVLASLEREEAQGGQSPVLMRQGPILASAFHPELTPDRRVHAYFAELCGC